MGVDDINYEDMDEDQTYATMQTIASYVDTITDDRSDRGEEEQRSLDYLVQWNTLRKQKEDDEARVLKIAYPG